ncbi:fasciclin domain-containing protein [Methanolobus sp.]|uniref:fasciclin domain-containing protein n=1 Tax=Methanolobus sp. TaxID=1874737 RepID=UPI0027321149|nr:fasciclin domain-containing protein [Methanolobus sp.]
MTASASANTQTTVVDIIVESPDHNTLEAAVLAAGLQGALAGEGPFTVFAPTDAAFEALPAGTLDALLGDPQGDLTNILLYHVLSGRVNSTDLSDGMTATTLLGKDVLVTIIGDDVFINNAKVTVADIQADNGVVHVIDAVLIPPATVVDIIVNSPRHNTLEAAVLAAGLEGALAGEGPFTVFAPTDDAFAALPTGTLDALLEDPSGDLTNILLYHVLSGRVNSTDLSDGMTATTLLGKNILVTINEDGVFINNAKVTVADIQADNGVVHVIDAVLIPPNVKADIIALKSDVASENLKRPIDRALQATLDAALRSVSRENENAAANQLNAFINQVKAQNGKAIDPVHADEWIASAQSIIDSLKK